MSTLIICPVCDTRYEIAAVFPPEGRKVRCSKCTHVWQAVPVGAEPLPMAPEPAQAPPLPPQAGSPPQVPQPAWPEPQQPAPAPPPFMQPAPYGGPIKEPEAPAAPFNSGIGTFPAMPPEPQGDASFGEEEVEAARAAPSDAGFAGAPPTYGDMAAASTEPVSASSTGSGSIFGDLTAAYSGQATGTSDISVSEPQKKPRKRPPVLAIGWAMLGLIVLLVVGMFALAPDTMMSMFPGAARFYGEGDQGGTGLTFEDVRYDWNSASGQPVLEVQGNVVNSSSAPVDVPTVVVALRDENGAEISEWTAELETPQLAAGEQAPFTMQIPSPPANVRSLKVRFAKAD